MSQPDLETALLWQIRLARLPDPVQQFMAVPGRRYRWDLAWPDRHLLLEIQGGVFTGGKHGRGAGIIKDQEKLNLATIHGYRVLQVSAPHLRSGQALAWVKQALAAR